MLMASWSASKIEPTARLSCQLAGEAHDAQSSLWSGAALARHGGEGNERGHESGEQHRHPPQGQHSERGQFLRGAKWRLVLCTLI
jgi:hypothetical protein